MEKSVIVNLTQDEAQEYFMLKRGWDKKKEAALFYPLGWRGDMGSTGIKILSEEETVSKIVDKLKEIQVENSRLYASLQRKDKELEELSKKLREVQAKELGIPKKKWYQ